MARHSINYEQIGRMEVDDTGRLYWDGREVLTTVSLPRYVYFAIVAGAVGAVVAAAWPMIRFFCYGS